MNDYPEKLFTIACLGDSITYGHGVAETRTRDAWPYVLQRLLGSAFNVLEYGRNGATAIEGVPDSYCDNGLLEKALASGADVFILMLGTNDTKARYWDEESYKKGLRNLALRLLGAEPSRLFLMLPPKAFPLEDGVVAYDINDVLIREHVIPAIKELAAELELPVIDLYALTEDHPEYYPEGVHPNKEGNEAIAEKVFRSVITGCRDLPNFSNYISVAPAKPEISTPEDDLSVPCFRLISNQVRFGCGCREMDGRLVYFAFHGYPNRNDDYFTTAEISRGEFYQIAREYPAQISADRETAEVFRGKYVDGHPVLLEGWNKLI